MVITKTLRRSILFSGDVFSGAEPWCRRTDRGGIVWMCSLVCSHVPSVTELKPSHPEAPWENADRFSEGDPACVHQSEPSASPVLFEFNDEYD